MTLGEYRNSFGKHFNRSLVCTGVWRGFGQRPRTLEAVEEKEKILKKATFIFCAKLWYALNPGFKRDLTLG